MPKPEIPDGWLRVKISHASLNRHDIFTLQGLNGQTEPIKYPMILGNDESGTLDDGTEVAIYPVMCDPNWHVFSELVGRNNSGKNRFYFLDKGIFNG